MNDNILQLLKDRGYFHEGENTWEDMSNRVALALASVEETPEKVLEWKEKFYELLSEQKFVNSSPTLMNADVNNMGGLSSCFVIDIKDDLEKIHKAISKAAKIYQYNGGVGLDISPLRPARAPLGTAHGYAGGAVAFMSEFNEAARVATLYNHRKSATKIDMQVWHPDIHMFIHCKDDGVSLPLMNISVSISDKFMEAVKNDDVWELRFPDYQNCKDEYNAYWDGDIESWEKFGFPVKVYEKIKARDLFYEICESAWKRGDPGVSFYDHLNIKNPNKHVGKVSATNPCAEFNSIPYTSCCLGSFNLVKYLDGLRLHIGLILDDVGTAVRMLDNVISANEYPIPEIEDMTIRNRSIGIGVMGLADVLYMLGIPYGSKQACDFVEDLLWQINSEAIASSRDLALEKGTYHNWAGSSWEANHLLMRNSDLTSIAPTGSISTICGVSSSTEPNFGLVYVRHTNDGKSLYTVNPIFEREIKERGLYSETLLQKISDNHGSCVGIPEIPDDMQKVFLTAHDITPEQHIDMTAAVQSCISLSVSKTVNLPNSATVQDVMDAYQYAFDRGLLGITVYRDGCRDNQVLTTGASYIDKNQSPVADVPREVAYNTVSPISRKALGTTHGNTYCRKCACGTLYITVNRDDGGNVVETFVHTSKGGICQANIGAVNRMASLAMRSGVKIDEIADQLQGINCPACTKAKVGGNKVDGLSCPDIIAKTILEFAQEKNAQDTPSSTTMQDSPDLKESIQPVCPECGLPLTHESGCVTCKSCGWSKCS